VYAINFMLFVVLHGQAKSNHSAERPHQSQRFRLPQIPTKMPLRAVFMRGRVQAAPAWTILVVKPQAIDIIDFIL
jgi:hypothetical protein